MKSTSQTWWWATQPHSSTQQHRQPQRALLPSSHSLSQSQPHSRARLPSSPSNRPTAKRLNPKSLNLARSSQRTENPAEIKAAAQPWPHYLRRRRRSSGAAALQPTVTSKVKEKVVQTKTGGRTPVSIPLLSLLSIVTHMIAHCEVDWWNIHWKDQKLLKILCFAVPVGTKVNMQPWRCTFNVVFLKQGH